MSMLEAKRRARKLRAEFRARGEPFTQTEFHNCLRERCEDLSDSALDGLVALVAGQVDREALKDHAEDKQPSLFDTDGEYKFGDGWRIAKEHAQRHHWLESLRIKEENVEYVRRKYEAELEEFNRLSPYLQGGIRKSEAVKQYWEEHGNSAAAG